MREWLGAAPLPGGSFVLTGAVEGTATFGFEGPNETTLNFAGERDPFAAVYNVDGQLEWAARLGTNWGGSGAPSSSSGLDDGTFLVAGWFEDEAEFLVDGELVTFDSGEGADGFLLHVCPL